VTFLSFCVYTCTVGAKGILKHSESNISSPGDPPSLNQRLLIVFHGQSDHFEFTAVASPSDTNSRPTQSSEPHEDQRTYHYQDANVTQFGNFVGWPASSGSPWCNLSGDQEERLTFITKQLTVMFKESERRQRLLACRASRVQMLLEFFRSVSTSCMLPWA
jgi:hypothetical protein